MCAVCHDAVAIANLDLEPTGNDISYLVFATNEPLSRGTLVGKLKSLGLPGVLLASLEQNGEWLHLAQVADFVGTADDRVMKLVDSGVAVSAKVIGAYAQPISSGKGQRA